MPLFFFFLLRLMCALEVLGQMDRFCVAGKVQRVLSRVGTPQAVSDGGTLIWTWEAVTSGCSGMRLPRHDGRP